jgi:L-ascorbate metabolism protein UlaG (beta-lactamase superfamily)
MDRALIMKHLRGIGTVLCGLLLGCAAVTTAYLQLPMFGQLPRGNRLEKIKKLPNYRSGKFHNIHETPLMNANPLVVFFRFLTARSKFISRVFGNEISLRPPHPLPVVKTNLQEIDPQEDLLLWFGHSSCFIQLRGRRILVDPLFSNVSSPLWFFPRAFAGTDIYGSEDMPAIDYLIITHDHWDHLDYKAVLALQPRLKKIICPLGVGQHFEYWGFAPEQIIEMCWDESISDGQDFTIHCLPARHFSGRGIFRNKSLWGSFLIDASNFKIYVGGDSGYDTHYAEIGKKFGPIDLVILGSGQYNENWKNNHMNVDDVMQASDDLGAKMLLPVHICKISLADHSWNEPLIKLSSRIEGARFKLLTPMMGEKVSLRSPRDTPRWWEKVR